MRLSRQVRCLECATPTRSFGCRAVHTPLHSTLSGSVPVRGVMPPAYECDGAGGRSALLVIAPAPLRHAGGPVLRECSAGALPQSTVAPVGRGEHDTQSQDSILPLSPGEGHHPRG